MKCNPGSNEILSRRYIKEMHEMLSMRYTKCYLGVHEMLSRRLRNVIQEVMKYYLGGT